MERKSGSSSRSPSLSRRPSLKDKKPTTTVIAKSRKGKKERWLLTRKTWRYMSDAVGNLLPEYGRGGGSRRGSTYPAGLPQQSSQNSPQAAAGPSRLSGGMGSGRCTTSPPQQSLGYYHHNAPHDRPTMIQGGKPAAMAVMTSPTGSSGSSGAHHQGTSFSNVSSAFPWSSFPSHRPGVTPTGPGPGGVTYHRLPLQTPAANIDPDDIPQVERHFQDVCTKEKKFLLWTRTKHKGLSGPKLREQKLQKLQNVETNKDTAASAMPTSSSSVMGLFRGGIGGSFRTPKEDCKHFPLRQQMSLDNPRQRQSFSPDYYSPDDGEFGDDGDDYDEYDNEDEQITVRERRKSSTASSTMSILGVGAFFSHPSGNMSDTSYAMVVANNGGTEVQKIVRNTASQTDPFPEELIIRLRLQAVHDERQKMVEKQMQFLRESGALGGVGTGGGGGSGMHFDSLGISKESVTVIPISRDDSQDKKDKIGMSPSEQIVGDGRSLGHGKGLSQDSGESGRESEEKMLDSGSSTNTHRKKGVNDNSHDGGSEIGDKGSDSGEKAGGSGAGGTIGGESMGVDGTSDKKSEESGYASSISDTVMKYLRIMRKNSKADNKETIDKFKTVNYDRSLRYIKSKNVTVEEALEHEKNKALGISNAPTSQIEPSTLPPITASPNAAPSAKSQASHLTTSSTTPTITSANEPPSNVVPNSSVSSGVDAQNKSKISTTRVPKGTKAKGKKSKTNTSAALTISCSSNSAVVMSTTTVSSTSVITSASPPPEISAVVVNKSQFSKSPTSSTSPFDSPTSPKCPKGGSAFAELTSTTATMTPLSSQPLSPPPPPPPKEVGIQAGESLIKFLKNLNVTSSGGGGGGGTGSSYRKFSDFSSSNTSESPVDPLASPRYSITATTGGDGVNDLILAQMQITGQMGEFSFASSASVPSSSIPTTTRSSFDLYSVTDSSEFDDSTNASFISNYHQHLLQYQAAQAQMQIQLQQHEQQLSQMERKSSIGGSTIDPLLTASSYYSTKSGGQQILSPIPASSSSTPGGSGYSSRHSLHQQQHHHPSSSLSSQYLNTPSSKRNLTSSSTPATPQSGSGSSLMKSFFSSSPFSSSFGLGSFGFKKPTSTTSLVTPSVNTPGTMGHSSTSSSRGLGGMSSLPPTTSSSPNLLSLVQSSFSSGSVGGFKGGSSDIASASCSSEVLRKQQKVQTQGPSVGFKGSLVPQKGLMNLPLHEKGQSSPGLFSKSSGGGGGETGQKTSGFFSRGSGSPTSSGTNLIPGSSNPVMQKSKSSSSVLPLYVADRGGSGPSSTQAQASSGGASGGGGAASTRLMSKSRIFKSRSKSSTRANTSSSGSAVCAWAPQGKCRWKSPSGKTMTLEGTTVLSLSELERQTLQEVALEKLKSFALGVDIKIPKEKSGPPTAKPKRRPYLLKKKALSTGFFESGTKRDDQKEGGGGSGMVFGIPLSQCVTNDRLRTKDAVATVISGSEWGDTGFTKRSQNGSRNSVTSVSEAPHDDNGSTESLFPGRRGSIVTVINPSSAASGEVIPDQLHPPPMSVPSIVLACVRHLENFGLHTTGIFRVSTSLKRIRQLREEIDGGKDIQFGEEHSPHDVAALLKEFLRDLPDPLLSRDLYQAFLKTQKIRNRKQQLEAVQHLVQLLPVANRDTLASLLKFFAKVVANAGETRGVGGELLPGNKMEGYSLATLIAPNILPCMPAAGGDVGSQMDQNLTKERRESIDVVNYMISNFKTLFEVSPELLHDVYLHLMDTQPEAVDGILKLKSGFTDDVMDEVETSSVFEGSECGDVPESEQDIASVSPAARVFRRREDILHEGAARAYASEGTPSSPSTSSSRLERTRERARGKRDSSRDTERMGTSSDPEKGVQSGGESDSSSTKSTSRWFRRSRGGPDVKTRTSSDSGSEKVKGSKGAPQLSGLVESKRANSLDSVATVIHLSEREVSHGGGEITSTVSEERKKSNSDQSLKVPENLNRRQSSPVLESSGVITASLKIPVPVPLSIDDTDIPFIEDDQPPTALLHRGPTTSHAQGARVRGRSASTDSSNIARTSVSSTSPISSPHRHPSSEVSSPTFSPPGSPTYDPTGTFPYEEMTARILIGSSTAPSSPHLHKSSHATSALSTVTTSTYVESKSPTPNTRPATKVNKSSSSNKIVTTSIQLQPQPSLTSSSSTSPNAPQVQQSPINMGKETKCANISGLIKSKTADFEKLAKSSQASSSASSDTITSSSTQVQSQAFPLSPSPSSSTAIGSTSPTSAFSIAPKMRLRSQENIVLKQQFLLRQQQNEAAKSAPSTSSTTSSVKRSSSSKDNKDGSNSLVTTASSSSSSTPTTHRQRPSGSTSTTASTSTPISSTGTSQPERTVGPRALTRRRHLVGSASSSAILPFTSTTSHPENRSSAPVTVTVKETTIPSANSSGTSTPPLASSPSRWKRSEIISSRQHHHHHHDSSSSSNDPETFV